MTESEMAEQYARPDWTLFAESIYNSGLTGWHEVLILGILVSGIIASLYFMLSARRTSSA